ncbi:glutathione S-transferase [Maricaulis salignorans]|uniref:glutathione transferase n=1 Tax=Maricaulis salignorans TaxID=144026 RepID=A0A1G9VPC8_9PROT|nr:glutathione S-transferase [Maricaulis salignorans]SDM73996.1 glutathione S-transferase [Maricaulis salignorans]
MITVHHLNNSRSQRILWLLEELGLEYEIKKYMRDATTMRAPADLKAVHPLGKSPVITDGDITVAESGAIIEYLVDTYGPALKPDAGTEAYRRYVYWLHFSEGSLMPPLLMKLLMNQIKSAPAPFFVKPIAKQIAKRVDDNFIAPELVKLFTYIEAELTAHDWFAGDAFSGADIAMSFPLEASAARGGLDKRMVRLQGFVDRIHARPAYQRALERGGEYGIVGN